MPPMRASEERHPAPSWSAGTLGNDPATVLSLAHRNQSFVDHTNIAHKAQRSPAIDPSVGRTRSDASVTSRNAQERFADHKRHELASKDVPSVRTDGRL